jgi:putative ABC transport system ATP-binding protein/lipoprotein-releasing system ATP-binding protein
VRLVARALTYAHPGHPNLLEQVDLEVRVGESVAVVGPSGSGKTTFLALLGGLLRPRGGQVVLEQHGDEHPASEHISWVLQTVNVLPDRTVLDNVAVGAFADGLDREAAAVRARAALSAVGLAGTEARLVRTLSGGEAQRIVIARAAVSDRPVLLADEPTGQLDQKTSTEVIDALLTSAADKITVVVTHDPAVAARCTRTMSLGAGRLTASAP